MLKNWHMVLLMVLLFIVAQLVYGFYR